MLIQKYILISFGWSSQYLYPDENKDDWKKNFIDYVLLQGANSKSEEDLKRDQMEKLVREELDNFSSNASLRSGGGGDSRPGTAQSRGGSRAPTAKSMYSQGGKSATSRGRKTAQGSVGSLRIDSVSWIL